jgi:hypothetical protein
MFQVIKKGIHRMELLHWLKCDNGNTLLRYTLHLPSANEFLSFGVTEDRGSEEPLCPLTSFDVDVDRTSTGGTSTAFPSTSTEKGGSAEERL